MWAAGGAKAAEGALAALGRVEALRERARWYALAVAPQAEFLTVRLLDQRGIFGFAPTHTVWRKANRFARRKTARTYPALTGYVIVALLPGQAPWFAMTSLRTVRGVVCRGGAPAELPPASVDWIAARSSVAPEFERLMRTRREFGVGDRVRLADEGLAGLAGKVVEIRDLTARVLVELFGAEREVEARLDRLEPAA